MVGRELGRVCLLFLKGQGQYRGKTKDRATHMGLLGGVLGKISGADMGGGAEEGKMPVGARTCCTGARGRVGARRAKARGQVWSFTSEGATPCAAVAAP